MGFQSLSGILITAGFLLAIALYAFFHWQETLELFGLLRRADTGWMILAILTQIPTYIFAGIVWDLSARALNYSLTLKSLTELAIEQLAVGQIIPSGGLAGNIIVIRAMKRFGLPTTLAIEIFFIETLSFYIAYALVALVSILILWWHNDITSLISTLVSIFFAIQVTLSFLIYAAVNHKNWRVLLWLKEKKFLPKLFGVIENISKDRVFSGRLLFETSLFRLGVFALDTLTLFAILRAIGASASLTTAFVALVIASIAGTVVLLPGGIGGYEAASILILNLFGVPVGSAIAATAILRGLTLWLPLIPGIILARQDLGISKK